MTALEKPPTIELFPGVQFRKRPQPHFHGEMWQFLDDGKWLVARHAYADDTLLDHFAQILTERDSLAKALSDIGDRFWHTPPGVTFTGPQLLEEVGDLLVVIDQSEKNARRYLSMRDCPWPGVMQQVGIVSRDNEAIWLHGPEADRKVDATMEEKPAVPKTLKEDEF